MLIQKQARFSFAGARLIIQAGIFGYLVTLGEWWRSDETCLLYAKAGKGIRKSNHRIRLALDLNLFLPDGSPAPVDAYEALGEWWKKQSNGEDQFCWGGDFKDAAGNAKPDIFHYSFEHQGVK